MIPNTQFEEDYDQFFSKAITVKHVSGKLLYTYMQELLLSGIYT